MSAYEFEDGGNIIEIKYKNRHDKAGCMSSLITPSSAACSMFYKNRQDLVERESSLITPSSPACSK